MFRKSYSLAKNYQQSITSALIKFWFNKRIDNNITASKTEPTEWYEKSKLLRFGFSKKMRKKMMIKDLETEFSNS